MAEDSAAAIEIPKKSVPVWLALGIQHLQDPPLVAKPGKQSGQRRWRTDKTVAITEPEVAPVVDDVAPEVNIVDVASVHALASVDKVIRAASNQAGILKKRDVNHARLFFVMDAEGQMLPDPIEICNDNEARALLARDGVGLVIVTGGGGLRPLSNDLVEALQRLRLQMANKADKQLERMRATEQRQQLELAQEGNGMLKPVLFWKATDKNGYLSNWGRSPFVLRGHHFNCAEQYLMWSKAEVMGDVTKAQQILSTPDPKRQKELGRQVRPWKDRLWMRHREPVMLAAARAKFVQNPELRQRLLATNPRRLAEASPSDVVWGIGLSPDNPLAQDPQNWKGENLLGRVLEQIRGELLQDVDSVKPELVNVSVRHAMTGELAWGPRLVESDRTLAQLAEAVSQELDKDQIQVLFMDNAALLLDMAESLSLRVQDGNVQLRLSLKSFEQAKLEEIHSAMGSLPGLTDDELSQAEGKYGFAFPPDLKLFLQVGLPQNWHNWRELIKDDVELGCDKDTVSKQLQWHATPDDPDDARLAREHPLIPLYSHRMMPSVPLQNGLPVFSMHQCSDNIVYGENLWEYLERDHHVPSDIIPEEWKNSASVPYEQVPFWSRLIG